MPKTALQSLQEAMPDYIDCLPVPGGHLAIHPKDNVTYNIQPITGKPEITA